MADRLVGGHPFLAAHYVELPGWIAGWAPRWTMLWGRQPLLPHCCHGSGSSFGAVFVFSSFAGKKGVNRPELEPGGRSGRQLAPRQEETPDPPRSPTYRIRRARWRVLGVPVRADLLRARLRGGGRRGCGRGGTGFIGKRRYRSRLHKAGRREGNRGNLSSVCFDQWSDGPRQDHRRAQAVRL